MITFTKSALIPSTADMVNATHGGSSLWNFQPFLLWTGHCHVQLHKVPLPWSILEKVLWFPVQLTWSMPPMVGVISEIFSHFYYEVAIAMFSYEVPPLPWSLLQKVLWFPVLQWCHLIQVKQQQELHYYRRNLTFIWWWDATTQL